MIILAINFSGNVGKSTLCQQLFVPRLNKATLIPIESINSDGTSDDNIRGRAFDTLMERMLLSENAIIDVGASNVEEFINQIKLHYGSHEEFDHVIIPTVPDQKQQIDTWQTVKQLNEIGFNPAKIKIIFNKLDSYTPVDKAFNYLFVQHSRANICQLNANWVVHENELFSKMQSSGLLISDLAKDETNYKSLIVSSEDQEEKIRLIKKLGDQRLSVGVNQSFDKLFNALELIAKD